MQLLHLVAVLCCLATGFAVPITTIKWCVISDLEQQKCNDLSQRDPSFSCVRKPDPSDCIKAIKIGEADAITLSGEYIYKAGQRPKELVPIFAEFYHSGNPELCSYSVAVTKKGTAFGLKDLKGKKSCHSGLGTSEGWILPIGTLISQGSIHWEGSDTKPRLEAVRDFFSTSCVPGTSSTDYPSLCQLCKGSCSKSSANDYNGDAGAFKCLAEGAGEVAFMNPAHIPPSEKNNYQLLCQDNNRATVDDYRTCHLGKEPAHAVVTRPDKDLADSMWTHLSTIRGLNLFSSEMYGGHNLMFSDSTQHLQRIPTGTDSFLYLGDQYMDKLKAYEKGTGSSTSTARIIWCAVGHDEKDKCDTWSGLTADTNTLECQEAATVEDCFKKIMRKEADAMAVDGGQVYTAGKCGLVPAMVEQYEEGKCSSTGGTSASSYHAVAVIKKGSGVTWKNLKGRKSCHTGMGRTAGWNIPMGLIHNETNNCDFNQYFKSGCAPGAEKTSQFCLNCKGSGKAIGGDDDKCQPSTVEPYYGYAGAFRCLAEDAGDVAFIKHTIVSENTDGNGPDWATTLKSENFELICPDQEDHSVPIAQYASCNLAVVPAHAVVTRPDKRIELVQVLSEQELKFGPKGTENFRMFHSGGGKNLLFKDSTKCLQEIQGSFETFLGERYMTVMRSLRQCSGSTPDLEKSCTFQSCP